MIGILELFKEAEDNLQSLDMISNFLYLFKIPTYSSDPEV